MAFPAAIDKVWTPVHFPESMTVVHGSCVDMSGVAVLLRGPAGSGKSDLAVRLIDAGAKLVSDDQVMVEARSGEVWAWPPDAIAGMIEVRGIGVLRVDSVREARLGLVVDLVAPEAVERLPLPARCTIEGIELPLLQLAPFEAAAAPKLRLAVAALVGGRSVAGALGDIA